jgi:hypothetical protein
LVKENKLGKAVLRITGLYMLRRLKAARVPKNRSRAAPFVRFFSTTFLQLLKLLRSFSIATAKTSYTTFALDAIFVIFF